MRGTQRPHARRGNDLRDRLDLRSTWFAVRCADEASPLAAALLVLAASAAPAQALDPRRPHRRRPAGSTSTSRGTPGHHGHGHRGRRAGRARSRSAATGRRERRAVPWTLRPPGPPPRRHRAATDGGPRRRPRRSARRRAASALAIAVRPFSPRAGAAGCSSASATTGASAASTPAGLPRGARAARRRLRPGRATAQRPPARARAAASAPSPRQRRGASASSASSRSARRPLTVLATGDSMIQLVDHQPARSGCGPRGVAPPQRRPHQHRDLQALQLDWVALARRQAQARRPTATVMFIGANDGFPIGGTQLLRRRVDRALRRARAADDRQLPAPRRRAGLLADAARAAQGELRPRLPRRQRRPAPRRARAGGLRAHHRHSARVFTPGWPFPQHARRPGRPPARRRAPQRPRRRRSPRGSSSARCAATASPGGLNPRRPVQQAREGARAAARQVQPVAAEPAAASRAQKRTQSSSRTRFGKRRAARRMAQASPLSPPPDSRGVTSTSSRRRPTVRIAVADLPVA